jgi:hypothetical protein
MPMPAHEHPNLGYLCSPPSHFLHTRPPCPSLLHPSGSGLLLYPCHFLLHRLGSVAFNARRSGGGLQHSRRRASSARLSPSSRRARRLLLRRPGLSRRGRARPLQGTAGLGVDSVGGSGSGSSQIWPSARVDLDQRLESREHRDWSPLHATSPSDHQRTASTAASSTSAASFHQPIERHGSQLSKDARGTSHAAGDPDVLGDSIRLSPSLKGGICGCTCTALLWMLDILVDLKSAKPYGRSLFRTSTRLPVIVRQTLSPLGSAPCLQRHYIIEEAPLCWATSANPSIGFPLKPLSIQLVRALEGWEARVPTAGATGVD